MQELEEVETTKILVEIEGILLEFSEIFEEPPELPPERDCNHRIPLKPG